jgi:hypothetical protein
VPGQVVKFWAAEVLDLRGLPTVPFPVLLLLPFLAHAIDLRGQALSDEAAANLAHALSFRERVHSLGVTVLEKLLFLVT